MTYYIYIIHSEAMDRFYIGYSLNPWIRLEQHKNNFRDKYTGRNFFPATTKLKSKFSYFHLIRYKSTVRSLFINSLIYFVLIVVYFSADIFFPGARGGLPIPDMSDFVVLGIELFSLIAFIVTLIRFFVKDNVSPAGFIFHGAVFALFIIRAMINHIVINNLLN